MLRLISSLALAAFVLAPPLDAQVTIKQLLQSFLESSQMARHSDEAIAERLSAVSLEEQLTATARTEMVMRFHPGPKTAEQLQILAAASIFKTPPVSELPAKPVPGLELQ